MCKQLKGQKGVYPDRVDDRCGDHRDLAAIAIPNFLQYQMKSRQSEAKTDLQAIKTSEVAFNGERGCYIGVNCGGCGCTCGRYQTTPFTWGAGLGPGPSRCSLVCCGSDSGNFSDIGFKATGNVMFRYGVDAQRCGARALYDGRFLRFIYGVTATANTGGTGGITTLLRLQKPISMAIGWSFNNGMPRLTMVLPIVQPVCSRLV